MNGYELNQGVERMSDQDLVVGHHTVKQNDRKDVAQQHIGYRKEILRWRCEEL